jgi:uncharacterized membrane protein
MRNIGGIIATIFFLILTVSTNAQTLTINGHDRESTRLVSKVSPK